MSAQLYASHIQLLFNVTHLLVDNSNNVKNIPLFNFYFTAVLDKKMYLLYLFISQARMGYGKIFYEQKVSEMTRSISPWTSEIRLCDYAHVMTVE